MVLILDRPKPARPERSRGFAASDTIEYVAGGVDCYTCGLPALWYVHFVRDGKAVCAAIHGTRSGVRVGCLISEMDAHNDQQPPVD